MTQKNITELFKNCDIFISLGYNCFFKKFIKNKLKHNKETNFFDYIGTSMWSINELLTNDFEDFFNKSDYKNIPIKINENNDFITNTKYYIRFFHDLNTSKFNGVNKEKYFKDFVSSYTRKKNRLYQLLNDNNKILFLRLEEDNTNRINYPEYEDMAKIDEIENLIIFTKIIKNKFPNLNFTVLFISKKLKTNIDESNNIIIINSGDYPLNNWKSSQDELENILLNNYEHIETFLQIKT